MRMVSLRMSRAKQFLQHPITRLPNTNSAQANVALSVSKLPVDMACDTDQMIRQKAFSIGVMRRSIHGRAIGYHNQIATSFMA